MKKIMVNKIFKILLDAVIMILLAIPITGITVCLLDIEYYKGNVFHYKGETDITVTEAAELVSIMPQVGVQRNISEFELNENGLVTVKYDFYSKEQLDFINKNKFSYFDSPLLDFAKEMETIVIIVGVFGVILVTTSKRFGRTANKLNFYLQNYSWYVANPKLLFTKGIDLKQKFNKVEVENINICPDGILGVRTWKERRGVLYSAGVGKTCWKTKQLISDVIPGDQNQSGCYSVKLGFDTGIDLSEKVLGIVSSKGQYLLHEDGVIRSESCEILLLIVGGNDKSCAAWLSQNYDIPVYVVKDTLFSYHQWLTTENGLNCLNHNIKQFKEYENGNASEGNKKGENTIQATIASN